MKYVKLQQDLVKLADKRDRGVGSKRDRLFWCKPDEEDGQIGIVINGFYIAFIREDMRYIDLDKVCKGAQTDIKRLMKDPYEAIEATNTDVIKNMGFRVGGGGKGKVRIFSTEKDGEIWIDENHLKYFDLDNSTFKGTDRNGPIYIYEADPVNRLVGYVLPVRHNEVTE